MLFNTVRQIHFSPAGTTRQVAETLSRHCSGPVLAYDLLRQPPKTDIFCDPDDLVIVALPVYSGRLPSVCLPALQRFRAEGTPALAVAVYGNRAYEDALLELHDKLTDNGFSVIGAAAVVARHSIFPQVAADRPHEEDKRRMSEFVRQCLVKMSSPASTQELILPGTRPYKEPKASALKPTVDETCVVCGQCVNICPNGALTIEGGSLRMDPALCLSCAACISVCAPGAQAFRGPEYEAFSKVFAANFSTPREPEFFV